VVHRLHHLPFLNFAETNCYCDIVPQCQVGHQIWVVDCDQGFGQVFTVRPVTDLWHQFKWPRISHTKAPTTTITTMSPRRCRIRCSPPFVGPAPNSAMACCKPAKTLLLANSFPTPERHWRTPKSFSSFTPCPLPYDQYNVPFALSPVFNVPHDNPTSWCLTNQHHPKTDEVVALKPCYEALQYNTLIRWRYRERGPKSEPHYYF
jgi:hypothetical protein